MTSDESDLWSSTATCICSGPFVNGIRRERKKPLKRIVYWDGRRLEKQNRPALSVETPLDNRGVTMNPWDPVEVVSGPGPSRLR